MKKNEVIVFTYKNKDGFSEYRDVLGNVCKGVFSKIINVEEADAIYNVIYKVEYCGHYFEVMALSKTVLETKKIIIVTQDEESARQFGFTKHEQFVFIKEIELKETTKLKVIKIPVRQDNNLDCREEEYRLSEYLKEKYR
ncbi:MAG: hypothetical protein NC089_03420 [Bacteroides sp.]|nr:hypothetical protein [Bacteroides sp.]MCM1549984.1 hypothetical protein [Clostridium sp.]